MRDGVRGSWTNSTSQRGNATSRRNWLMYGLVGLAVTGLCAAGVLNQDSNRSSTAAEAAKAEFYEAYEAYRAAPPPEPHSIRSYASVSREQAPQLVRINHMTPRVLPYLIRELRRTRDTNLNLPLAAISRLSFIKAEWPEARPWGKYPSARYFVEWWEGGQALADEMFAEAYAEGDYERVAALGTAVLPRMMEKLEAGDERILPAFRQIAVGQPVIPEKAAESREACLNWWKENKQHWTIPFPDQRTQ